MPNGGCEMKDSDSFLDIDENRLDEEWITQPKLYGHWAKHAALTRRKMDEAKSSLELVQAELDLEVRSNPEKFGIAKITENVVKSFILQDTRYVGAQKKVNAARYDNEVAQAAVTALEHRKYALQNLVSLFLSSYYAEPKAPKGRKDEVEDMTKQNVRRKGRVRREE